MRRGEVIGELALLRQATRTASVRARRDAELLELERESFDELIRSLPGFALRLTHALGERLASRPPAASPEHDRRLDVDGGQLAGAVADQLVAALRQFGSVGGSDGRSVHYRPGESTSDKVVLSCSGTPDDPWTDVCVTEAHVLVALSRGGLSGFWREHITPLQGCELLVLGGRWRPASSRASAARGPRRHRSWLGGGGGAKLGTQTCGTCARHRPFRWWRGSLRPRRCGFRAPRVRPSVRSDCGRKPGIARRRGGRSGLHAGGAVPDLRAQLRRNQPDHRLHASRLLTPAWSEDAAAPAARLPGIAASRSCRAASSASAATSFATRPWYIGSGSRPMRSTRVSPFRACFRRWPPRTVACSLTAG